MFNAEWECVPLNLSKYEMNYLNKKMNKKPLLGTFDEKYSWSMLDIGKYSNLGIYKKISIF